MFGGFFVDVGDAGECFVLRVLSVDFGTFGDAAGGALQGWVGCRDLAVEVGGVEVAIDGGGGAVVGDGVFVETTNVFVRDFGRDLVEVCN